MALSAPLVASGDDSAGVGPRRSAGFHPPHDGSVERGSRGEVQARVFDAREKGEVAVVARACDHFVE